MANPETNSRIRQDVSSFCDSIKREVALFTNPPEGAPHRRLLDLGPEFLTLLSRVNNYEYSFSTQAPLTTEEIDQLNQARQAVIEGLSIIFSGLEGILEYYGKITEAHL